ncbi:MULTISPECIES: hypothetical protein [Acinetobacter]|uniref:Lipoprotein n=1 Tax=Acinetobacter piscicola TaxID=2006115 RepID=A0A4Q4H1Q7_9GAMM|nr:MULTISPECIES: hypothetical protein [Acinetobacter]MDM1757052.1 hypothetical protein [Acinetobacter sp. 256-1]MDM1760166.1 hypothetical protein [Acinetobacter sp. 251-1]QOW46273.1 hypothetical protein G0028_10415 [Acinetobacter piscicola]RYL27074.1 hypothetical protein EWP19_06735 [Acinetobacter piscicola]
MSFKKYFIASLLVFLSGCSAKVITYDAAGNAIGACKATQGFIFGAKAVCYGHGNAKGIDYRQVNIKTGLLPIPPASTQIQLD